VEHGAQAAEGKSAWLPWGAGGRWRVGAAPAACESVSTAPAADDANGMGHDGVPPPGPRLPCSLSPSLSLSWSCLWRAPPAVLCTLHTAGHTLHVVQAVQVVSSAFAYGILPALIPIAANKYKSAGNVQEWSSVSSMSVRRRGTPGAQRLVLRWIAYAARSTPYAAQAPGRVLAGYSRGTHGRLRAALRASRGSTPLAARRSRRPMAAAPPRSIRCCASSRRSSRSGRCCCRYARCCARASHAAGSSRSSRSYQSRTRARATLARARALLRCPPEPTPAHICAETCPRLCRDCAATSAPGLRWGGAAVAPTGTTRCAMRNLRRIARAMRAVYALSMGARCVAREHDTFGCGADTCSAGCVRYGTHHAPSDAHRTRPKPWFCDGEYGGVIIVLLNSGFTA
jgi:hypothetical protein